MRRQGIETKVVRFKRATRSAIQGEAEPDPKKWREQIMQRFSEYRRELTRMGLSHLLLNEVQDEG